MNEIDRPRTAEELAALPIGPSFDTIKHEITEEERSQGFAIVHGKKISTEGQAKYISAPIMPATISDYVGPDDVLAFELEGQTWLVGRYADGRYFRRRSAL